MKIQSSNIKCNVFICNILLIPSGLSVGRIVPIKRVFGYQSNWTPALFDQILVLLFSLVGTIFILITTPALISTYESFVLHSLENGTDKQK